MADEINISNGIFPCNCPVSRKSLRMLTTLLQEPSGFPVMVHDVATAPIAIAYNKQEYMDIWNSSLANNAVGYLIGAFGPYSFVIVKNSGPLPNQVYGNPLGGDIGEFNDDFEDDFNN